MATADAPGPSPASATPAIRLTQVGKTYIKRRSLLEMTLHPWRRAERVEGLVDVDLTVPRGTLYGLLGPNGAGKTTLLKILSCLILPNRGRAEVDGRDVATEDREVKQAIGFVTSDERSFYWRLTGEQNLEFFARLYGLSASDARRRTRELLGSMELDEVAKRQFMSYSSGMKQRLAICRALLHDPPILCLDEPTRSLDPIAAKHLRQFIRGRLHRERGKTILLATHNLQEAEDLCQRLAVLHRGRVLREGSLHEIAARLPGREQYFIDVTGLAAPPDDPRWTLEPEPRDGYVRLAAAVDRGGRPLSDLLKTLLSGGATIVACTRREPGLQEVFDQMEREGVR
jgi:ABC-2 type transport system ATP-binding protein